MDSSFLTLLLFAFKYLVYHITIYMRCSIWTLVFNITIICI
jgi:hypothetical protein